MSCLTGKVFGILFTVTSSDDQGMIVVKYGDVQDCGWCCMARASTWKHDRGALPGLGSVSKWPADRSGSGLTKKMCFFQQKGRRSRGFPWNASWRIVRVPVAR